MLRALSKFALNFPSPISGEGAEGISAKLTSWVVGMPAEIAYGSRHSRLPYAISEQPLARASLRRAFRAARGRGVACKGRFFEKEEG